MPNALVLGEHRDRVIDQLSSGFAGDRFEVEELEHRIALAHAAETPAALDALVTDLAPVTTALVPSKRLRVVLGSIERRGAWAVPALLPARVLWGNLELDLREAQLAPGLTTIDVHVTMGNVELVVPPGVAVEIETSATLANVEDRTEPSPLATHRLRITGRVTLGNLEVTTQQIGET
ncbi:MAG: LiaF domain-containing protein [Kofleriaceae bacterium]